MQKRFIRNQVDDKYNEIRGECKRKYKLAREKKDKRTQTGFVIFFFCCL